MNAQRALELLHMLADGTDPFTGADFPPDSPYQQADTVRALHAAIDALEHGGRQRKPEDPTKPKAGSKWTPEEIQRLEEAFRADTPFTEIAAAHGRTRGAITARPRHGVAFRRRRVVKLGLLDDNATNRSGLSRPSPPGAETDAGNRPPAVPPHPASSIEPAPPAPAKKDLPF